MDGQDSLHYKLDLIRKASELYYKGSTPILSDKEYDELVKEARLLAESEPDLKNLTESILEKVGFGGESEGGSTHAAKMMSLDNIFTEKELSRWLGNISNATFVVEPKLDGLSIALTYSSGNLVRAVTRGDGTSGEDVSYCLGRLKNIPSNIDSNGFIEVRGEVVFTKENYEKANIARAEVGKTPYSNPRNAAAGAVRAEDLDYNINLSFYAHGAVGLDFQHHSEAMRYLNSIGFATTSTNETADHSSVAKKVREIESQRWSYDYEIDGAVIKVDSLQTQRKLGETSRAPKWAIAYKYAAAEVYGVLSRIENQVGRLGTITPVGKLESPVSIGGVMVESVTLHNFSEISKKDLRIGDTVIVRRAGEVIPEIVGAVENLRPEDSIPYSPPENCPSCGGFLTKQDIKYVCASSGCRTVQYLSYVGGRKILDIQGLGEANARKLVDAGLVTSLVDLYSLTYESVASLPRFGLKSSANLIGEITKSKKLPLQNFIAALGLPLVGPVVAKKIAQNYYTFNDFIAADSDSLLGIRGIGGEIVIEIERNKNYIEQTLTALQKLGCSLDNPIYNNSNTVNDSDKIFVATGSFPEYTRESLKKYAESKGWYLKDSVTPKTKYLVTGKKPSLNKVNKAKKLEIPTIKLQDFLKNL